MKLSEIIQDVIYLVRFVRNVRSYDIRVVEISLIILQRKLSVASVATILIPLGLCDALMPLLTLSSRKRKHLVRRAVNILSILALNSASYDAIVKFGPYHSVLASFLKGNSDEKKLAGRLICNMFRQSPHNDEKLMSNTDLQELLIKLLKSSHVGVIHSALSVIDDLTYHGENVRALLVNFGVQNELCLMAAISEFITTDNDELQSVALNILLNCLAFVDSDSLVRAAVLSYSLSIESILIQV
jgi:hypothetical protein